MTEEQSCPRKSPVTGEMGGGLGTTLSLGPAPPSDARSASCCLCCSVASAPGGAAWASAGLSVVSQLPLLEEGRASSVCSLAVSSCAWATRRKGVGGREGEGGAGERTTTGGRVRGASVTRYDPLTWSASSSACSASCASCCCLPWNMGAARTSAACSAAGLYGAAGRPALALGGPGPAPALGKGAPEQATVRRGQGIPQHGGAAPSQSAGKKCVQPPPQAEGRTRTWLGHVHHGLLQRKAQRPLAQRGHQRRAGCGGGVAAAAGRRRGRVQHGAAESAAGQQQLKTAVEVAAVAEVDEPHDWRGGHQPASLRSTFAFAFDERSAPLLGLRIRGSDTRTA